MILEHIDLEGMARFLPEVGDTIIRRARELDERRALILKMIGQQDDMERQYLDDLKELWTEDEMRQAIIFNMADKDR